MTELEKLLLNELKRAMIALDTVERFDIPSLNMDSYDLAGEIGRAARKAEQTI